MNNRLYKLSFFVLLATLVHQVFAQELDVEEVVIFSEYIPDEKLETSEVADLLDADTMSIAGDSDLGGALKRVPGLSLVGGRFIYVRGLGERYSATYFNGTPMPSPEPLQRAVPLDLFDTSITKDVLVQKTHSANFGLDFSGGAVDIRSAAVPEEGFFKVKVSTGYNDISTSKKGLTSNGGSRDWLGVDDDGRSLPNGISQYLDAYPAIFGPSSSSQLDLTTEQENVARLSFTNNDWEARSTSNPYDYGISLGGGNRFDVNDRINAGFIGVASLSNRWRNRFTELTRYSNGAASVNLELLQNNIDTLRTDALYGQAEWIDGNTGISSVDPAFDGSQEGFDSTGILTVEDQQRTQRRVRSNLLLSVGIIVDEIHFINLTNMLARKSTDTVTETISSDYLESPLFQQGVFIDWVENEVDVKQLNGEHFLSNATINWRLAQIDSKRDNLDSKTAVFESRGFGQPYTLRTSGTNPSRNFSFLDDSTTDYGVDIEIPLVSDLIPEMTLKFGASKTEQDRDFQSLVFTYYLTNLASNGDSEFLLPLSELLDSSSCVADAPNDSIDGCYLATDFGAAPTSVIPSLDAITLGSGGQTTGAPTPDFYQGKASFESQYLTFDIKATDTIRLNIGVRNEDSLLEVRDRDGELLTGGLNILPPLLDESYQLFSYSFTWDFYENMILRGAYSDTVNRPILRELALVQLFNPEDGRIYQGNPSLRTSEIQNYDIRYEIYFGDNDYFSLSGFKKRIKNPIEQLQDEVTGEVLVFSWTNSELAVNEGFEFELRKYIGPYFYVSSNATFMESDVTGSIFGGEDRPLTGVSKELYNAQLVYEGDTVNAALSFNKYSRRVYSIARSLRGSALVYEEPFETLDANIKYKFFLKNGQINIGFKASNLLDESIVRVVDNLGQLPFENYDIGRSYSFSLEWKQ